MTAQQPYELVRQTPHYELRRYRPHILAETLVRDAAFEDAGNSAFRSLFGYISGESRSSPGSFVVPRAAVVSWAPPVVVPA